METITSHTYLWVVRKNLTSIMNILLVVFVGFSGFGWFKSSFGVVFFYVNLQKSQVSTGTER